MEVKTGGWKEFCSILPETGTGIEKVKRFSVRDYNRFGIYPDSVNFLEDTCFFIARENDEGRAEKFLIIFGDTDRFHNFNGRTAAIGDKKALVCEMNNDNCDELGKIFPFIRPVNHRGTNITIGLGDRLGLASPGHLRLIKNTPVFPVIAQQSIRELNLTGRTYRDVTASASWAAFQEGFKKGFGADGDHLKTAQEVKMALDCGFTMITLDCSEHIDNSAAAMPIEEVNNKYSLLPSAETKILEEKYLIGVFELSDSSIIKFRQEAFKRSVLVYLKAIKYTIEIYNSIIKKCGRSIDFEMSIDETQTPTSPEDHYFVASELIAAGLEITSLAPRFCGEFQKGIDYRGDKIQFASEFAMHVKIAKHFGYKISVHSGSDKFSVFPIVGEKTCGKYHLKTAGTSWLEAVRIIALKNPALYRRMHNFALENLNEAKKYYHISAKPSNIPDLASLKDEELPGLMDKDDSRQVMHITYGLILLAKDSSGSPVFRNEIYAMLNEYEEDYYKALVKHIGRHLIELGIEV